MSAKLIPEQVATVIKAVKILSAQCLAPDMNVKTICQAARISHKTGYQRANKVPGFSVQVSGFRFQVYLCSILTPDT
jgi:hypothetical protein